MVSGRVFASVAALSIGGVGAFHVPVLHSTSASVVRRSAARNSHVSRMSAAADDGKDKSFYPFQRSNAPSARCDSVRLLYEYDVCF